MSIGTTVTKTAKRVLGKLEDLREIERGDEDGEDHCPTELMECTSFGGGGTTTV